MSFTEIKKSVNSDLNTPLDVVIKTRASQESVNNLATQSSVNNIVNQGVFKTLRSHGMMYENSRSVFYFSGNAILYGIKSNSPISSGNSYDGKLYINDILLFDIKLSSSNIFWYPPLPIFFNGVNGLKIEMEYSGSAGGTLTTAYIFN